MTRKQEDIRTALDKTLSFVSRDPTLFSSVINASKGDTPPMKRKLTLSMALAIILILTTATVAVAAAWHGVAYFLSNQSDNPVSLDPDYLLSDLKQNHNSKHLNASVMDAYWDGLSLSIAYHVAPAVPGKTIMMECANPEHSHYRPVKGADILLQEPDFVNITDDATGKISHPMEISCDWLYEDDGSLSVIVTLQHYNMAQSASVSVPIFHTLSGSDQLYRSMLHCYPPTLADPIESHEHLWSAANCITLSSCAVCKRIQPGFGEHNYRLHENGNTLFCQICGDTMQRPHNIPKGMSLKEDDNSPFVMVLQLRLQELGYYNAPLSGYFNAATKEAVKAFQKDSNLIADGLCGPVTMSMLFPE